MKTERVSTAIANGQVDLLSVRLDGGFLDLYDGVQPATVDTPLTTQVKLASLRFADPGFADGVDGVATSFPITKESDAPAAGTATWYRCFEADHVTAVQDGSIGTTEDFNLVLSSADIQLHSEVSIDGFVLAQSKS